MDSPRTRGQQLFIEGSKVRKIVTPADVASQAGSVRRGDAELCQNAVAIEQLWIILYFWQVGKGIPDARREWQARASHGAAANASSNVRGLRILRQRNPVTRANQK